MYMIYLLSFFVKYEEVRSFECVKVICFEATISFKIFFIEPTFSFPVVALRVLLVVFVDSLLSVYRFLLCPEPTEGLIAHCPVSPLSIFHTSTPSTISFPATSSA